MTQSASSWELSISKEVLLYIGDTPPMPKNKIMPIQEVINLGISKVSEMNALLRAADMARVTITIVNPTDISLTSSTGVVASEYRKIVEWIMHKQNLASALPWKLNSWTSLIWLTTNGNVMAILIRDKTIPTSPSEESIWKKS